MSAFDKEIDDIEKEENYSEAYLSALAESLKNKASGHFKIWLCEEAEDDFVSALQIYKKLAETNPDMYLPHVAATL